MISLVVSAELGETEFQHA